jgi:4-hydroxybenzoate polyprenyltransferase
MLVKVKNYLSLVKFSHTIFALPFALIGFFTAITVHNYPFSITKLWLVLGCMVFARSAAMAFNRWVDASIDAKNPRTAIREIPAGLLKANHVLWFTIWCSILFMFCAYMLNDLCFYLSPIALLVILGYSFTKRFTRWCHLVLGLGLSLAPIGAYLAVTGEFNHVPILFGVTVLTWVAGFDVIYALQDEIFDKKEELHSIPVRFGARKALFISETLHVLSVAFLITAGYLGGFSTYYIIGTIIFAGLLVYQHLLVKPNDLSKVNLAFFTTNGIASLVFACFVLLDFYLKK